jgi:sec-independent protein translocase protein TatA
MVSGFLSPVHVALLLVVAVMLFGAKRLPELGSSLGKGMRDFKDSLEGKSGDADASSVVGANAPQVPAAGALQSAPPVVVQPSVAQPAMSRQAADEAPTLPPVD